MAGEPRFSYLYNSHSGSTAGGIDERDSGDQALRTFAIMHKTGADSLTLGRARVEVIDIWMLFQDLAA